MVAEFWGLVHSSILEFHFSNPVRKVSNLHCIEIIIRNILDIAWYRLMFPSSMWTFKSRDICCPGNVLTSTFCKQRHLLETSTICFFKLLPTGIISLFVSFKTKILIFFSCPHMKARWQLPYFLIREADRLVYHEQLRTFCPSSSMNRTKVNPKVLQSIWVW